MKLFELEKPRKRDFIVIAIVALINTIILLVVGLIWQAIISAVIMCYFGFMAKNGRKWGQDLRI